jgi:hypothetical protein
MEEDPVSPIEKPCSKQKTTSSILQQPEPRGNRQTMKTGFEYVCHQEGLMLFHKRK